MSIPSIPVLFAAVLLVPVLSGCVTQPAPPEPPVTPNEAAPDAVITAAPVQRAGVALRGAEGFEGR
ncbi:MAG: hypothetical protein EOP85_03505 [Verrucomicrobiaceae bacterium]|nr:MAG: hypothetical protein EOP85_03505 [Verrucomicrobiaceae bacterium]